VLDLVPNNAMLHYLVVTLGFLSPYGVLRVFLFVCLVGFFLHKSHLSYQNVAIKTWMKVATHSKNTAGKNKLCLP